MDDQEQALADDLYQAIQHYTNHDTRGQQAQEYRVGVSDLGYCSERLRRMLTQEDPEDSDMFLAFLGTAIGDHLERAVQKAWGNQVLTQQYVNLHLVGDSHTYDIPGHPDIIFPRLGILLDGKTARGLSLAERNGANRQQNYQRHGYAKAAHEAGLFGDLPLAEVQVGNCWIDRAGDDKRIHVQLEPFDPAVIVEMTEWLEEVIYAYTHNQEAPKEPPREVCAATCGFFATCRAFDTDIEGLLTDQTVVSAIAQYRQGLALEREGARLKDQAKPALADTEGFALIDGERMALRWVHINETTIPGTTRRAYDKIDLRKVK